MLLRCIERHGKLYPGLSPDRYVIGTERGELEKTRLLLFPYSAGQIIEKLYDNITCDHGPRDNCSKCCVVCPLKEGTVSNCHGCSARCSWFFVTMVVMESPTQIPS